MHIEKQFRVAHDFANSQTGAGIEEGDPHSFDEAIVKKCVHYFDLLEIMGFRSGAKPMATMDEDLESTCGSSKLMESVAKLDDLIGVESVEVDEASTTSAFTRDVSPNKKQKHTVPSSVSVATSRRGNKVKNVICLLDEETNVGMTALVNARTALAK